MRAGTVSTTLSVASSAHGAARARIAGHAPTSVWPSLKYGASMPPDTVNDRGPQTWPRATRTYSRPPSAEVM